MSVMRDPALQRKRQVGAAILAVRRAGCERPRVAGSCGGGGSDRPCAPLRQEGGREKSFRYWPRLGSRHNTITYGRFKITTRFRTDSGCYATTGLKMKHLLTGQERTVWHLQYTDWPEHGCPGDLKGFLCECPCRRHGLCRAWRVSRGGGGAAYFPERFLYVVS